MASVLFGGAWFRSGWRRSRSDAAGLIGQWLPTQFSTLSPG